MGLGKVLLYIVLAEVVIILISFIIAYIVVWIEERL